jgi:hypothetical protein
MPKKKKAKALRSLSCYVTDEERGRIQGYAKRERGRSVSQFLIRAALLMGDIEARSEKHLVSQAGAA